MTDDRDRDRHPEDAREDEDREAILARRARFVATALVGLTGMAGCDPTPQPCLNIAEVRPSAAPQACLKVGAPSEPPAPAPSSDAGTEEVDGGADGGPPD